jgi:hypothetical protein
VVAVGGRAQTGTRDMRGVAGVTNSLRVEESPRGAVDCTARIFSGFPVLLVDLAGYRDAALRVCGLFNLVELDAFIRVKGLSGLGATSRWLGVSLGRCTVAFLSCFTTG